MTQKQRELFQDNVVTQIFATVLAQCTVFTDFFLTCINLTFYK